MLRLQSLVRLGAHAVRAYGAGPGYARLLATLPRDPYASTERSSVQIDRSRCTQEQAEIYDEILESRKKIEGPFKVWLNNPELARRASRLGEYIRYGTCLGPVRSELTILLTGRMWNAQVEWSIHEHFAREAGLCEEVIDAARRLRPIDWSKASEASQRDRGAIEAIFNYVKELHETKEVSSETHRAAVSALGKEGVIDVVGISGYYSLVAMTLNAFHVELPKEYPATLDPPRF